MSETSDTVPNERRSKAACSRCRLRKSKCSGEFPCTACINSNSQCIYPRKKKKIKVYDTEIEALQNKIRLLERELEADTAINSKSKSQDLNLSVLLKSPSCELICWNLMSFMSSTTDDLTISPEFNSFIEENMYDSFLSNVHKSGESHKKVFKVLESHSFSEAQELLAATMAFLNNGYLTINLAEFTKRLEQYYTSEGNFNAKQGQVVDYFLLKVLMVLGLGTIYGEGTCLSANGPRFTTLPGYQYFEVVLENLPANFELLIFKDRNITNVLDIIELFGLVSIFCRILDKKSAACYFTSSALQLCISINLHRDSLLFKRPGKGLQLLPNLTSRSVFWSAYCLNRFSSTRIGYPLIITFRDIESQFHQDYGTSEEQKPFFDSNDYIKYYIELAHIAEVINTELYNNSYNPRKYLNTLFHILTLLQDWNNSLPAFLHLEDNSSAPPFTLRCICSLHLNHLHHVYLTCIPISLHLAKLKILYFNRVGELKKLKMSSMPKNIQQLMKYCQQSCQKTVNIFMELYDKKLLRAFGQTEIDYLSAVGLVSVICLVLNFDREDSSTLPNFEANFKTCLKLISDMANMGNRVAQGKLQQINELIDTLGPIFSHLGCNINNKKDFSGIFDNGALSSDLFDTPKGFDQLFRLQEEDLSFLDALLNDYDNIFN